MMMLMIILRNYNMLRRASYETNCDDDHIRDWCEFILDHHHEEMWKGWVDVVWDYDA